MIRIITNKKYSELMEVIGYQSAVIKRQNNLIDKLRKENSILNHAIAAQHIDFPNSAVRSSDLYDPVDKLF